MGLSGLLGLPGSLFPLQIGEVFLHYLFKYASVSCCSSSPSCTPIIQIMEHFQLPQMFKSLSSFFEFLFLHSVLVGCLFLPFVPNCCFESQFPYCHCWFPEYFALFHFGYLYLFLHFVTELNQFCEHPDYQGFALCIRWVVYLLLVLFLEL